MCAIASKQNFDCKAEIISYLDIDGVDTASKTGFNSWGPGSNLHNGIFYGSS